MTDIELAERYLNKHRESLRRGIEFSLTLTAYKNLRKARRCYYTGVPLTADNFSIDRVDSSKGYVNGNCVACDREFNMRKGGLSVNDLQVVLKALKKRGLV